MGGIFYRSIYTNAVRFKNIPFLVETVPKCNKHIVAESIMTSPVYSLEPRASVSSVYTAL